MSGFGAWLRRLVVVYGEALLLDILSVVLAYYLALALRFSGQATLTYLPQTRDSVLAVAVVYCLFNGLFGLYGRIWRYASSDEIIAIIESATTATLLVAAVDAMWPGRRPLPLSVVLAGGLLTLGGFAATRYRSRLFAGLLRRWRLRAAQDAAARGERVIIVGAGEAGQLLAWRLRNSDEALRYRVIGFIDDDSGKQGLSIHGVKVVGGRQAIPELVQREAVELIVIAINRISSKDFEDLLSICQNTPARIKTLPDVFAGLEGRGGGVLLRDISIEDLVGREQVSTDRQACRRLLEDKSVLVTGAGGSIGSELCRQIVQYGPRLLVMLDNNETSLHDLALELRLGMRLSAHEEVLTRTRCVVADITRRTRMMGVFRDFRPEIILHAAAYKHVPLMEEWPQEALRVNVGGTLVLHELAVEHGSERFVFVSTDKAVEPTCIMGATKWLAETLVTRHRGHGKLVSSAVRFGNVLGSRGSVTCIFQRQIDTGGPVTVTHPEATRFFMSVGEAASMILQAASLGQGGEAFILDMGEQIKITDLAHKMIRLRGLRVGRDIPIVYSGLRPGEKLYEKLASSLEQTHPTSHPRISCVRNHCAEDHAELLSETLALLGRLEQADPPVDVVTELWAIARARGLLSPQARTHDQGTGLD